MSRDREILGLFDKTGRRKGGAMEGINYKTPEQRQKYIDAGYIPVPKDEYAYYCDTLGGANRNGYLRDPITGKPVDAPPRVMTKEDKAQILYNDCQKDLKQIDAQLLNATVIGDDELVEELKQEREDRITQYQKDLEELEGSED